MDTLPTVVSSRVAILKEVFCELKNNEVLDEKENLKNPTATNLKHLETWNHYLDLLGSNENYLNIIQKKLLSINVSNNLIKLANSVYCNHIDLTRAISKLKDNQCENDETFTCQSDENTYKEKPTFPQSSNTSNYLPLSHCRLSSIPQNSPSIRELHSDQTKHIHPFYSIPSSSYSRPSFAIHTDHNPEFYPKDETPESTLNYRPPARQLPLKRTRANPNPIPIQAIALMEWSTLSAHLSQRLTISEINAVIEDINMFLRKKYKLLQKPLQLHEQTTHYKFYKHLMEEQNSELNSVFCFSENDLKYFDNPSFRMDAHGKQILTTLRYLSRLTTITSKGLLFYCLVKTTL